MAIIFSSDTTKNINENLSAMSVIYTAAAAFDAGETGVITYSLDASSDQGLSIDSATGKVSVSNAVDYELKSSFNFVVVATDDSGNAYSLEVSVSVNNLDEQSPIFTSPDTAEAIDGRALVYRTLSDDSKDTSAGVTYSLKSGLADDASLLTIDANTGAVSLASGVLDSATKSSYSFTVVASDGVTANVEQATTVTVKNASADNIITAGIGDETIDGGAGFNTLELPGAEYHYILTRQDDGSVVITPIANTPFESEGAKTVSNIQLVKFLQTNSERILDDVANVQDSTNQQLNFGETFAGQIFKGDTDWFQLTDGDANQAVHVSLYGGSNATFTDGSVSITQSFWPDQLTASTLDANGDYAFRVYNTNLGLNAIQPYNVVVYRDLTTGTAGNDSLATGTDFEYVDAGDGNDTIVGSDRDEYFIGGLGDDTITVGGGNNIVIGGDEKFDTDTVIFAGNFADYKVTFQSYNDTTPAEGNWWRITHRTTGEVSFVKGVEQLQFDDQTYTIDDYDSLQGADISGLASYAGLGELIEGRYNLYNDRDWIPFNFDWDMVDKNSTIKIAIQHFGDRDSSIRIVNATGFALQFTLPDGTQTDTLSFNSNSANEFLVNGIQWGPNAEGGGFGGGQAFIVMEGSGHYGYRYDSYSEDAELPANAEDIGRYTISISRFIQGDEGDNALNTKGPTDQESAEEIAGLGGNDTITGSVADEILDGGLGDDSIIADGGNDQLIGGAGNDSLYGGAGDDRFIVEGESTTYDIFDGGTGTDTITVSGSVDFSNATFTSIEKIQGTGSNKVTLTEEQAAGLSSVSGVVLTGSDQQFVELAGNYFMLGTTGNDTIVGGDGNNTITANAGDDSITAGAGDDLFIINGKSWDVITNTVSKNIDSATGTISFIDSFDGGLGTDTLQIDFSESEYLQLYDGGYKLGGTYYWFYEYLIAGKKFNLDFTGANIDSIENIRLISGSFNRDGVNYSTSPLNIFVTHAQLDKFSLLDGGSYVVSGGGTIDLSSKTLLNNATISFSGDDAYFITGTANADAITTYGGADSITSGAGNDVINSGKGVDTIVAGDGNDKITIDSKMQVFDSIDGGAGTDTLTIKGGSVDLSQATITGFERIEANSTSLALTEAQYAAFSSILTGPAGLVLKVSTPGTHSVADLPDGFVGIQGTDGADNLIGSDAADVLSGGAGADTLTGGAGDDVLVAGTGVDNLSGGAGYDTLDVRGKAVVGDRLAGGSDIDTLLVEDGQNLSGATITGIEKIKGTGTISMYLSQLAGVTTLDGVSVQLLDDDNSITLPSISLVNNAKILLSNLDTELLVSKGVVGTPDGDTIIGSSIDDTIYGGRGSDIISGGVGNDTLYSGKGVNTLTGGDGDDTIVLNPFSTSISGQSLSGDIIDGGMGSDNLILDFGVNDNIYKIIDGTVTNVEALKVTGSSSYSHLYITNDVLTKLDTFEFDQRYLHVSAEDYADFSISNLVLSESNEVFLYLKGQFGTIDLSDKTFSNAVYFETYSGYYQTTVEFDQLIGSDLNDTIYVNDYDMDVKLNDGDDRLYIYSGGVFSGSIDGGAGSDTLDLSRAGQYYDRPWANNGVVDISGLSISNVENIYFGNSKLIVSKQQADTLSFDGTGSLFTTIDNVLYGTDQSDTFYGFWNVDFEGGKGDDTVNYANTVIFSGNFADYDITRSSSTLTVQHARGEMTDGTDTLVGVQYLRFADTPAGQDLQYDDAPDSPSYFIGSNAANFSRLNQIEYGKKVSASKDYSSDQDVFAITLVPNSPIFIDASTPNGSTIFFYMYDAVSGQQINFESLVRGNRYSYYRNSYSASDKWLPVIYKDDQWVPYEGGNVVLRTEISGINIEDYAFTINYLDDYAGSVDTLGKMNAQEGIIRGYVGDIADQDWIRTELIAGTKYEFRLTGVSSGGGSLTDPLLKLLNANGVVVENGIASPDDVAGTDDAIIFRPTESGTFYLSVADVGGVNKGSWTLTQNSLDTIAGNISTTERIEWTSGGAFRVDSEINELTDHDWFKVWLDKGVTYEFNMDGTSLGGTLQDPQLTLRSVTGILVAQDDNSGTGTDAIIYYSAPESGWYFLDAGASGNGYKGTYSVRGSSLQDDFSNDVLTTGVVELDVPLNGLVSYIGDSDWVKVGLSAGKTYVISLTGDISDGVQLDPLTDPLLFIRSADGSVLLRADDFGSTLNAQAYFTPEEDGLYYIESRSAFRFDIGAYQLDVTLAPPDDHGSLLDDSATTLTFGADNAVNSSGSIGIPGDKDVFSMTFESGKVYQIELSGQASNKGTLIDPIVRIFDANGNLVDWDNNGGLGNDASFYFVPPSAGDYFIEVAAKDNKSMGTFQLDVAERNLPPDDAGNDTGTTNTLTPGEIFQGNLLTHGDEDWFAIDLVAGKNYVFRAKASHSGNGTLEDPVLELRAADGTVVKSVDNMLTSNEPAFPYTPSASGKFYLVVKAANPDTDTGSYTLITRAPDDHGSTKASATAITLNETIEGGIQWNDGEFGVRAYDSVGLANDFDEDWFSFTAVAGQILTFSAEIADGSALSRPLVEIVDAQGRSLALGDGLETNNGLAAATFKAAADSTYYARLIDGAGATGNYTVSLTEGDASDEDSGGPQQMYFATANGITVSEVTGVIGLAGDTDSFEVTLQEGHSYRIETVAVRDGVVAPLPSADLNMTWKPNDSGTQVGGVTGQWTDNGDGTFTLALYVSDAIKANWVDGIEAVDVTVNYDTTVMGSVESVSYASGAFGAANTATPGSVVIASVLFPTSYDVNGTEAIAEITFGSINGDPTATSLSFTDIIFNESDILPIQQVSTPSFFSEGEITADADGTLSITVSPLEETQTGKYKLRVVDLGVSEPDDFIDSVTDYVEASDGVLAINESVTGKIDPQNDKDLVAVNLSAGNIYDFSVKSFYDGLGTLSEATLRLLDVDGNLVSVGSLDNETNRTELSVSVFEDGRYFLEVAAPDIAGNTGTYTLDTRLRGDNSGVKDDISADTQSGVLAGPGQPATGEINFAGDHDWIRVNLEAGKVYVLDVLAGGDGAGGTLADSTLRLLDAEGNELAFDDNTGAGNDSHIQYSAKYTGEYYLDVSSKGTSVGTYTMRVRELYSGVADPLAAAQWYIDATNVSELNNQYSGAGITVGVVDDGLETHHPDLQENINFALSFDTQFDTNDGKHKYPPGIPFDFHGTPVAGIIAATANNETGVRGVAYDADVASTRVKWTWDQITQALGLQWQFDISNNSWGAIAPFSDNFNNTNLTFAWLNIRKSIEDGRDGKGTVMVFSAGNSAGSGDNTNYHNFQNAREVITVGAANQDGSAAGFSTPGASVLVSTYGVGLMTTDRLGGLGINGASDYAEFTGTSASAPLVSAIVALMLEANPNLGYRDVQKILAYSSTHPEVQDWKVNGAGDLNLGGLKFNDKAGFGLVDAYAAVQLAKTWDTTNTSINEASASNRKFGMLEAIPDGTGSSYTMSFNIDSSMTVEHVELGIDLRHERLGDVIITLTSPDGTVSTLMDRATVNAERPFGLSGTDSGVPTHLLWDFSSVQFWGEDAAGTWTISVTDVRAEKTGTIQSLSLRIYGEQDGGNDVYVFTDEGFVQGEGGLLEDESGTDTINASPVRFDLYIDLTDGVIAANATTHGIADWTIVENAYSGSGDDRLVGNDASNVLKAGDGDDTIQGGIGNDTIDGGQGSDTVVYAGNEAEYGISWDPNTETLTITDNLVTGGDEGTDTISGVERIVFADAEISLSAKVGNRAPVANTTFFDTPIFVDSGMGIDFTLPDNAFSDADEDQQMTLVELLVNVTDAAGGELPDWLSFDPVQNKFVGVPPEDYVGQLKLKVEAVDEYGESTADILTLQFGDNQAPVLEAPREVVLNEDAGLVALSIDLPVDPESTDIIIEILSLPSSGALIDKNGLQLAVGSTLTADQLTEVHYQTLADANGDMGYFRYRATDGDGVTAESSVKIFVNAVNDAPRFATESSTLTINYPEQTSVPLDVLHPSDPESEISFVRVSQLPEVGNITLDGALISLDDVLTFDQLDRLVYNIDENINGPVGALGIQAQDEHGLATNWLLNLTVSGEASFSEGTAGNDELYGSIAADVLYGKGGDDTIVGNAGDDRLLGGLGNDKIFGGSGNDNLDGSAGNDYLEGGSGNDIMAGGPGHDVYFVDSSSDIVLEAISGGAGGEDLIVTEISLIAPDNVEMLEAATGKVINLTGNTLDNTLLGNAENNLLSGAAGRDYLFGEAGNDTLDGGSGVDTMSGGEGDDTYYIDSKADKIVEVGNQGIDHVFAASSYTLSSNIENLTLQGTGDFTGGGNSLDNHIIGNSGNNILAGGLGVDTLEGGMGNDTYILNDTVDVIIDTGGVDTIRSSLDVSLMADIENIELVGIANSVAIGNGLDNEIIGNMADNILEGAGGVDKLTGGQGADQFVIANNGSGVDADLITDFMSGEDLIVIDLASFGIDAAALGLLSSGLVSEGAFVKGAGAVALDPNDHFIYDTATGILKFDADGSGSGAAVDLVKIYEDPNSTGLTFGDVFVGI